MKKIIVMIIPIILMGCLFSCTFNTPNESEKEIEDHPLLDVPEDSSISTKITYSIDNKMYDYNSDYSKRGVYADTENRPNAPWYYTIAMGQRNTGGFSIEIEKVNIDENENVEIIVKEYTPDGIVTMALTYPTCKLTLNKEPNSIVVKNTEGETYKNINF